MTNRPKPEMTTAESALAESIDALVDVARLAGIDAGAARDEGPGSPPPWRESVPGATSGPPSPCPR